MFSQGKEIHCAAPQYREQLREWLRSNFKEAPFIQGQYRDKHGKSVGLMEMWRTWTGNAFTYTITYPNGMMCILDTGINIKKAPWVAPGEGT